MKPNKDQKRWANLGSKGNPEAVARYRRLTLEVLTTGRPIILDGKTWLDHGITAGAAGFDIALIRGGTRQELEGKHRGGLSSHRHDLEYRCGIPVSTEGGIFRFAIKELTRLIAERHVSESTNFQKDARAARLARLAKAPKKPRKVKVEIEQFERNPDVIVEVLYRAKGFCEICTKPAPFTRATNGEPYLEVHHIIPLAENGDDTIENALALCPNCHREVHFGIKK